MKNAVVALVVAAGAAATLLPDRAIARDGGFFGNARARCSFFAQPVPLHLRERPAVLARYAGVALWDKREGGPRFPYHYQVRHNRDSRCLAGF